MSVEKVFAKTEEERHAEGRVKGYEVWVELERGPLGVGWEVWVQTFGSKGQRDSKWFLRRSSAEKHFKSLVQRYDLDDMMDRRKVIERFDILPRAREEIEHKMRKLESERGKYKEGSLYEVFLGGVIQGLHYTLHPNAAITMRDIEGKSKKEDLKEESE